MTLRDQYEADRDLSLSTELPWVVSCTYNGNTVSASFQIKNETTDDGRVETAELIVSAADVASVTYRDVVIVDGATWYAMRVISSDRYGYRIELYRAESPVWQRSK